MNYRKKAIMLITLGLISYNLILPTNLAKAINTNNTYIEINEGLVTFRDPIMDQAVRSALQLRDSDDIKESDLLKINHLSSLDEISSLDGIEKMTNLQSISLDCAKVKDLSPIKSLNLYRIFLKNLNINESELSFLKNHTNLTMLYLNNCNLSQIPDISSLKELTDLELKNNNISDIKILSNFNKLESLSLNDNNITDISAIKSLSNLEYLHLINNNIVDISATESLSNLRYLCLSNNKIKNINNNNKQLKLLYIDKNPIENISTITNITSLEYLDISYTNISDLNNISKLDKLYEFKCSGLKNLTDISNLIYLPNLFYLKLNDNPQIDLNTLSTPMFKDKLKKLYISNSNLTDLNFMKNFNPKYLNIENNKIKSLEALKYCSNLERILARKNEITSLKGLKNLENLEAIYIEDNKLTLSDENKNILSSLLNLKYLNISKNPIQKIEFNKMKYLIKLDISDIKTSNIEDFGSKLPKLLELTANNMTLDNLMFLNNHNELGIISLHNTKILNQKNLASLNLSKLFWLEINDSNIKNLSFLKSISNEGMSMLDISNTNVDFSSIPKDFGISNLQANNCNLKNLNLLPNLNEIRRLTAQSNDISILDLKNMSPNVSELDFSHNKIQEVKNISKLKKLKKFNLEDNIIHINPINFEIIEDEKWK